ncbi:hypothetical protein SKTS_14000 [Sulfurimicrobium lacus]|uniref:Uncharacterized protein n=1 Tax=Sulfurimicrobium lacus TaxID=2715678 RepID=A0A6F8VA26_9PROT|nr:hypothetical protein [Sulfurimicrobium lacus]BCB26514.1 hypothetical protein SKTS_14000 [Sulfurimicrobium lacus]
MPSATAATPQKKSAKLARARAVASAGSQLLTGQALLDDMEAYRKKVAATPDSARSFLTRLGVMTPSGKVKKLIRG